MTSEKLLAIEGMPPEIYQLCVNNSQRLGAATAWDWIRPHLLSVFETGLRQGRDEALPIAAADIEALVSAGLLMLAEKEDEKAREEGDKVRELAGWPYSPPEFQDWINDNEDTFWYDDWTGKIESPTPAVCRSIDPADLRTFFGAYAKWDEHRKRAACLREMSKAVSLGQFRTAETNERAVIAAHRTAAGFDPSTAGRLGGKSRTSKLTPERRREIAAMGGRAKARKGTSKKSNEKGETK